MPYAGSWDEVYEWLPQGVVVTSEVSRHRELIERAAEAEAQVLCEHPLAATEADAKAMVDACDIGGVLLTLASPACFGGAFAAVRRGIADGALGTLTTMLGSHATRAPAGRPPIAGSLTPAPPSCWTWWTWCWAGSPLSRCTRNRIASCAGSRASRARS